MKRVLSDNTYDGLLPLRRLEGIRSSLLLSQASGHSCAGLPGCESRGKRPSFRRACVIVGIKQITLSHLRHCSLWKEFGAYKQPGSIENWIAKQQCHFQPGNCMLPSFRLHGWCERNGVSLRQLSRRNVLKDLLLLSAFQSKAQRQADQACCFLAKEMSYIPA